MVAIWLIAGGGSAAGPEDEMLAPDARAGVPTRRGVTVIGSGPLALHALLGLLTALLVTYLAGPYHDDAGGRWFTLGAIAVTAIPGVVMFLRWRRGSRPDGTGLRMDERDVDGRGP